MATKNRAVEHRLAKRGRSRQPLTAHPSLLTALLPLLLLTLPLGRADENSPPDFKAHTGKNAAMPRLAKVLPKYTQVFGLFIHATAKVPDAKLLHAANIAAEYLDNDLDGKPDNRDVNQLLWDENAGIIMAATEREMDTLWDRHESILDRYQLQDLYATETVPNGGPHNPRSDEFDASLEEILHIITSVGYAEVYPDVFGEHRGSDLAKAMDIARGGYFRSVPRAYPAKAWYTYDDRTCDYACQATEYIYWALTSLLGGQDFAGRAEDIEDEWKLNTPAKLRAKDKAVVKILTDPKYRLPTRLPDGKYNVLRSQPLRLDIIQNNGSPKFTLSAKDLPKDKTIVIQSSVNLKKWELDKRIPKNTSRFNFPFSADAEAKYFRLHQE